MIKNIFGSFSRFVRRDALLYFCVLGTVIAGGLTLFHHGPEAHGLLTMASIVGGCVLVVRLINQIREGQYGVDILGIITLGTAIVLGQAWTAIALIGMLEASQMVQQWATWQTQRGLRERLRYMPQQAHIIRKNKPFDVAASAVHPDDLVVVYPGELVPVDATVVSGTIDVSELTSTGEYKTDGKQPGATVLGGSVNGDSELTVRATASVANSQYQHTIRIMESAASRPAPFTRLCDRYSLLFSVVALTIAGVAWILSHQPVRFLDVLVVATPFSLTAAAPLALLGGMARSAQRGIIFKSGTIFENLADAKTFIFNQTGTLTQGKPTVADIIALRGYDTDSMLTYAAALEQSSQHPLAQAIRDAAHMAGLRLPKLKHIREVVGQGVEAHVGGKNVLIGRRSFLETAGISLPESLQLTQIKQTVAFVAVDGELAGYLTFSDDIRPDSAAALTAIRHSGIKHTMLLSGAHPDRATAVAESLGISDFVANATPAEKILAVERLTERPVVFVGYATDAGSLLTAADVGVAFDASGNPAKSSSADVLILRDSLGAVSLALHVARYSFRVAGQTIAVGVILSTILMFIFAVGHFPTILGVLIRGLLNVLVIVVSLRTLHASK